MSFSELMFRDSQIIISHCFGPSVKALGSGEKVDKLYHQKATICNENRRTLKFGKL